MSAELSTFALPRAATIEFNDVHGPLPLDGQVPNPADFDAAITSQVRNTGRFENGQYGISDAPVLADYGAVLVEDLREVQQAAAQEILDVLGLKTTTELTNEHRQGLHPDEEVLLESLNTAVVVVANSAPRRSDHHEAGRNGDAFYVAVTSSGVEVYAQAAHLASLDARGLIKDLYYIPDSAGIWPDGEQFRSSIVTQARRFPERLVPVERDSDWPIPALPEGLQLVFTDKFGNTRWQTEDIARETKILKENETVDLVLDDGRVCLAGIRVVTRLTDIPENSFGVYPNPADRAITEGPAYLELVRRVSDCNGSTQPRAYAAIAERVGALLERPGIRLGELATIGMRLVPGKPHAER